MMRVAVVGCGTAGAAAAILLHDAGHDVTVIERFAAPAPVGAGILLQPTGMAVLERLGLLDEILARGSRVDRLSGVTVGGRAVLDLRYADWRPDAFGLGLHRHALFSVLWEALASRGITVRTGETVAAVPDGFDLVLGCDGARSALRRVLGPQLGVRREREYPWGALWAIVDDPEERYAGALAQTYRSTREMVGFLPSGRPDGTTAKVSIFVSLAATQLEPTRARGLGSLVDDVRALTGTRADPILEQLTDMDQLTWAGYHDVVLRRRHAGHVAVLGDAAHAMSPQLGQGANLALLDAWVLAGCVREHTELGTALAAYTAARARHLRFYSWASRLLTPVFQSRLGILAPPRDLLAEPAARIPWVRDQMVGSLAGVKTGPWSELEPLSPGPAPPPAGAVRSGGSSP